MELLLVLFIFRMPVYFFGTIFVVLFSFFRFVFTRSLFAGRFLYFRIISTFLITRWIVSRFTCASFLLLMFSVHSNNDSRTVLFNGEPVD